MQANRVHKESFANPKLVRQEERGVWVDSGTTMGRLCVDSLRTLNPIRADKSSKMNPNIDPRSFLRVERRLVFYGDFESAIRLGGL